MPEAGRTHHVTLRDSSSTNKTGIKLLRDPDGKLLYGWRLAPALAPDVPPEDVRYGQFNPDQELTWAQSDWHKGGLKFYAHPEEPGMYGLAKRVWARTPNELSLSPYIQENTFGVANGGAQLETAGGWTESGLTISVESYEGSQVAYSGRAFLKCAAVSLSDYAFHTLGSLETISRYAGNRITVPAKVRSVDGTGAARVQIVETGGASTPTTNGTAVSLTTSWQSISATVVLQADTTGITIRIQATTAPTDGLMHFDHVQAFASAGATERMNQNGARMVSMGGDLFAVTQSAIYRFDETNDYFTLQKVFSANITGVEVYDNRIYVALGEATAYQYSNAADATVWTVSTLTGTAKNANFFAKGTNTNGNWALFKTLNDDDVHVATDPTNSGSWGSAIEAGKDDHAMTNLYGVSGSVAVGKQDGLYIYRALDGNQFVNIFPGGDSLVDANNFSRGIGHLGWFYSVTTELGFVRTDGVRWESLAHVIAAPGFSDFGNRIRALGSDGQRLYIVVEDLTSAGITKVLFLLSVEDTEEGWQVHSLNSFYMSDAVAMQVFKLSTGTYRSLFINGELTSSEPTIYRWSFPERTQTPRLSTTLNQPEFQLFSPDVDAAYFVTSYWDGNRPDVQKIAHSLAVLTQGLSGTASNIIASYQVNNESSWTNINSTDATFNTSPYESINFNANVAFRRIRLRFQLVSDTTAYPVLKAFVLRMHWRPARKKVFEFVGAIEDNIQALQGVPNALPAKKMISQLSTLLNEAPDVTLEDIDGTEITGHIIDMGEVNVKVRGDTAGSVKYSRGVSIAFLEG